ncbi:unnamed protein product, partial [Tenebrio molitor]
MRKPRGEIKRGRWEVNGKRKTSAPIRTLDGVVLVSFDFSQKHIKMGKPSFG